MKSMTTHKTVVAAVAVLAALALPMMVGAADKLVVKAADGTTDKFIVTDGDKGISAPASGYLGVGTSAPSTPLHIKNSAYSLTSAAMKFEFVAQTLNNNTAASSTNPQPYWAPNFTFLRNNELTPGDITLPRLNDNIGSLNFSATGITSSAGAIGATIIARAANTWTAKSIPTKLEIYLNPGGDNVGARQVLAIAQTGTATFNGGLRIYPYSGTPLPAKPGCASTTAGTLWFTKSTGVGVADKLEVCVTLDGFTYLWKAIAFQ